MELKSKEEWRAHLAEAMKSAPPVSPARAIRVVSTEEYVQALRYIEPEITENQRSMLISHAAAPGQVLTMSELAASVGFPNYNAANLQYGQLAGKLADAIGIVRPKYLVYVLASFDDDPDTSQSRAHLYPELLAALQQLGWVEMEGGSQHVVAPDASPGHTGRSTVAPDAESMLPIQQVIETLERYGFTRPDQSGLKVVRFEHSALAAPLFVKQSSGNHAHVQAPLVLHPSYENQVADWLSIPGIERGHARYYHNSNLRSFPKRRNRGTTDIAYGVDLGFQHMVALEQFLASLTGAELISAKSALSADFAASDYLKQHDLALTDTEREALIKARIGQGNYREALLAYWGSCAVTDCSMSDLLRASHIKPWRDSSAGERLDPFNGLLLIPNLDLAFDQRFISFDRHGQILLSEQLDPTSAKALNITPELRLRHVHARHQDYLAWHRQYLFRK